MPWTDLTLELIGLNHAFPCEIIPGSHAGAKSDYCAAIRFADGSVAGITFSAKGHTFEGVREVLQAHRGDALVSIHDFHSSTVEIGHRRGRWRSFHRNHGHCENILRSYNGVIRGAAELAVAPEYLAATARLFLGVRVALDDQISITVDA